MNQFFASIMHAIKTAFAFLRAHLRATIITIIVLFLALIVFAVTRPKQLVFVTAVAQQGDLKQTVEAVGTVISEKDLELQFPSIDVVSGVMVKEGDTVKAGQRLATLRSGSLSASVASASANVQSAQAQLQALEEGSRPEDIAIAEASVANKRASLEAAKQTLASAESNLITAQSQLTVLKSEASISLSGQVSTAGSTAQQYTATAKTALLTIQGVFNATDVQDSLSKTSNSDYDSMRFKMDATLAAISTIQSSPNPSDYQVALTLLDNARRAVSDATEVVNRAYDIMSNLVITSYFTNTSRETNKTTIATQKSNVQSALSAIDAAAKALRDATATYDTRISTQQASITSLQGTRDRAKADIGTYQTSLAIDEAQLALKKAPARQTDIDAARARVRQAQADLGRAAAQWRDTVLTAPVDGIITQVNVKTGEMRPSATPSITMLGQSPYRIEMFVSEVDIPKVQLHQTGSIVLDAFRDTPFKLHVGSIDSAPTDKDGVPKYRIKLDFDFPHDELKVGMTGDAAIVTGMRANVVSVPLRAVIEKNGTEVVRVLKGDGKTYDEKPVTTGMEGEGGNIEVTGVGSGTTVIVLIKE
jgi:HlyD family secretion protein